MSDELRIEALEGMRARGITNASELLAFAEPAAILCACRWWDRQKGVGAGLLASKVRAGGMVEEELEPENPATAAELARREMIRRFERYSQRWRVGSVIESHMQFAEWPRRFKSAEECECAGQMVVYDAVYPVIGTRCDRCGLEVDFPLRVLDMVAARATALRRVA